ncbi:MAG: putative rane protein [Pedosphaera sp.]|nr:putative rane protein [Pedosphaera sp.]
MFLLQLRNELRKLFGKKRTYLGFGMFLLAQSAFILVLKYGRGPNQSMMRMMQGNGYAAAHFFSNLTVATTTLLATAYVLLPLYVSLVGGDLVAKEAEDGTLRMILSRPISRLRILLIKWLAGVVFSLILILAFAVFGACFSRLFFPEGGLFVSIPWDGVFGVFEGVEGWQRYAAAHLVLTLKACTIMSLAFMFSCFDIKPAAATIVAISLVFISKIMQDTPYFHDMQGWFFTYHMNVWVYFFAAPIPWWKVGESLSILAGFNLTFFLIGSTAFQIRDFKS